MNQKELLVLAIGVFLTIVAWMMVDIYHLQNKEKIESEIKSTVNTKFMINEKVLKTLQERK